MTIKTNSNDDWVDPDSIDQATKLKYFRDVAQKLAGARNLNFLDDPAAFSSLKKQDPKPVVSLATEQINLKYLYNKVIAAQEAYSAAYYEWLRLGEHISDRLKHEKEERQTKL